MTPQDAATQRRALEYAHLMTEPHLLYFPVNPLDSDSVETTGQNVIDALNVRWEDIKETAVNDWTSYIMTIESMSIQYQQDVAFLVFYLSHMSNKAIRKYLPNGEGKYDSNFNITSDSKIDSMASMSAIISYFSGQTAPNEHFQKLFDIQQRTYAQSFNYFADQVMNDLVDFYNFPGMPAHFREWLANYIFEVKVILYGETIAAYELNDVADSTPEVDPVTA